MSTTTITPITHEHRHHHASRTRKGPGAGFREAACASNWLWPRSALWLLSGIYIVPADQQAVVTRFGQVIEPRVFPGIHLSLPWPIDRVTKLKVQQLQRLVVGGDLPDSVLGRTQPLASQFLTGDQNIINLRAVVQYSVGTPADYLFRTQDVAKSVAAAVETELARRIGRRTVDAVLTTDKIAIQEEARAAAQKLIDAYGAGVRIASINIESMTPPPEAADAFRDVASARADAARIYNEALGYANDVIPKARGEAQQMTESAAGLQRNQDRRSQRRCGPLQSGGGRVCARIGGERPPALPGNAGTGAAEDQEADCGQERKLRSDHHPEERRRRTGAEESMTRERKAQIATVALLAWRLGAGGDETRRLASQRGIALEPGGARAPPRRHRKTPFIA